MQRLKVGKIKACQAVSTVAHHLVILQTAPPLWGCCQSHLHPSPVGEGTVTKADQSENSASCLTVIGSGI